MAVAKADFQTRICFAFLARVVNEYNPGARYKATMAQHMDYFRFEESLFASFFLLSSPLLVGYISNNAGADKIRNIQSEVDKVKVVMQKNIDDILARGEKIDKLVEDTERLESSSRTFKEGSATLKRALWCRNIKLTVAIVVIALAVIFFIIVGICGGFTFPKCGNPPPTETTTTTTTAAATSTPPNRLMTVEPGWVRERE